MLPTVTQASGFCLNCTEKELVSSHSYRNRQGLQAYLCQGLLGLVLLDAFNRG